MIKQLHSKNAKIVLLILGITAILAGGAGLYLTNDKKSEYRIYEVTMSETSEHKDHTTFNVNNLTKPNKIIFNQIKSEDKVGDTKKYQGRPPSSVQSDITICENCGSENEKLYDINVENSGEFVIEFYIVLISFISLIIAGSSSLYLLDSLNRIKTDQD